MTTKESRAPILNSIVFLQSKMSEADGLLGVRSSCLEGKAGSCCGRAGLSGKVRPCLVFRFPESCGWG